MERPVMYQLGCKNAPSPSSAWSADFGTPALVPNAFHQTNFCPPGHSLAACFFFFFTLSSSAGVNFYETNERELILETDIRWGGNPNVIVAVNFPGFRITAQVRIGQLWLLNNIHILFFFFSSQCVSFS